MTNRYLPEGCLIGTPENRELISSLSGLERARDTGKILEGTVLLCDSAMRLHVDLYGIEGRRSAHRGGLRLHRGKDRTQKHFALC